MPEEAVEKDSKFMDWIENTLAPMTRKIMAKPWLSGFTNGVLKCLPFILTGCLIFFYNAIKSWIPVLPDLTVVMRWTFQMLAIFYAFMIPRELMATLHHRSYMVVAGLASVGAYFCVMAGTFDETASFITYDFSRFGPTGSIVAMFTAIYVSVIFHLYAKYVHLFKKGSSVPTFVQDWINNILPIFITILITGIVVEMCQVDLYDLFQTIFSPIQYIAQSLPGFLLAKWVQTFFYTIGVSGWTWTGIDNLYQVPAQAANLAAMQNGTFSASTAMINVSEVGSGIGLINLGGIGATFALNIWLLTSKSKRLRTLGRVTIGPSLFNINEPVLYGTPVVYNPILLVPANVCTIVGSLLTWFILRSGLLSFPNVQATNVGTLPVLACTVMLTGDLRGILWWFVFLAIYLAIWYPFFKVFEKGEIEKENGKFPVAEVSKLETK